MLSRIRGWQRRVWGERSHLERVEIQHRAAVQFMHWFFYLSWLVMPIVDVERKPLPLVLAGALVVVGGAQCLATQRIVPRAIDHYLGRSELPARALLPLVTLTVAAVALILGLQLAGGTKHGFIAFLTLFAVVPLSLAYSLLIPVRAFLRRHLWIAAAITASFAAVGVWDLSLLAIAGVTYAGPLLSLASVRCGAWSLGVMLQAEQNRDAQARLAVAEERLRFGRDLHDVMGRNLAVIALKSELAVQLTRRGRPEAVDQMIEVQRIAQESQREVREVVRGYREAGLEAELAGAQGVLTAAGIDCRVTGAEAAEGLPPAVHAALGWVVREAATNVLRHGDPRRCEIALTVTADGARLLVENDGAPDEARPGGSGLAGLRERLAVLRGTLEAGPAGDARFRLLAEVPLPPHRRTTESTARTPRTSEKHEVTQ